MPKGRVFQCYCVTCVCVCEMEGGRKWEVTLQQPCSDPPKEKKEPRRILASAYKLLLVHVSESAPVVFKVKQPSIVKQPKSLLSA